MAAKATTTTTMSAGRDLSSEIAFLTRALKAPALRESVPRLAERARSENGPPIPAEGTHARSQADCDAATTRTG